MLSLCFSTFFPSSLRLPPPLAVCPCLDGRKRWLSWVNKLVQQHETERKRTRCLVEWVWEGSMHLQLIIKITPSLVFQAHKCIPHKAHRAEWRIYEIICVRLSGKCLVHSKGPDCWLFFVLYSNSYHSPTGFQPTEWSSISAQWGRIPHILFIHIHSSICSFKQVPRHEWAGPSGIFLVSSRNGSVFPQARWVPWASWIRNLCEVVRLLWGKLARICKNGSLLEML